MLSSGFDLEYVNEKLKLPSPTTKVKQRGLLQGLAAIFLNPLRSPFLIAGRQPEVHRARETDGPITLQANQLQFFGGTVGYTFSGIVVDII